MMKGVVHFEMYGHFDDPKGIPDYIFRVNSQKKGTFYIQKTDNFCLLNPSYIYTMKYYNF